MLLKKFEFPVNGEPGGCPSHVQEFMVFVWLLLGVNCCNHAPADGNGRLEAEKRYVSFVSENRRACCRSSHQESDSALTGSPLERANCKNS